MKQEIEEPGGVGCMDGEIQKGIKKTIRGRDRVGSSQVGLGGLRKLLPLFTSSLRQEYVHLNVRTL